jgi:hypothetical protein
MSFVKPGLRRSKFPDFAVNALLTIQNVIFKIFTLLSNKFSFMKKIIMSLFLVAAVSLAASAQTKDPVKPAPATHKTTSVKTKTPETKMKSKNTTTVPQKVNNAVRPKHKKYKGHKTKTKSN